MSSLLSARVVIKEDHLRVFVRLDNCARRSISRALQIWIHIDDLSVALVSEEQALVRVGVDFEIWGVQHAALLLLPVVETQISLLWHNVFLLHEVRLEILSFHAVG